MMGGAAGCNASPSAQTLAASRNIELAIWQLSFLLHDASMHVNSLKLLECLLCCKTTVKIIVVVLARLFCSVEIMQVPAC